MPPCQVKKIQSVATAGYAQEGDHTYFGMQEHTYTALSIFPATVETLSHLYPQMSAAPHVGGWSLSMLGQAYTCKTARDVMSDVTRNSPSAKAVFRSSYINGENATALLF